MDVYLLRHGLTDDNSTGTIQGHLPTPLNAQGRRQAGLLARRFGPGGIQLDTLVSSDLPRAVQTAQPVADVASLLPVFDAAWRERSLGEWEGKQVGLLGIWSAAVGLDNPPGGETSDQFTERVRQAMNLLPGQYSTASIGVVTHGGPIRTVLNLLASGVLAAADGVSLTELGKEIASIQTIANCSIMHLECQAGESDCRWRLIAVNDIAHLDQLSLADAG